MKSASLINKELVLLDIEANDKVDLLTKLSSILKEKGYVKKSYVNAVVEREKVFPTGLITESGGVAIPHTDAEHVEKSTILFAKLKKPVTFKEMGNNKNDVSAEMVFMLAISDPSKQAPTLSKLMSIFVNKSLLLKLKNSKDSKEIVDILVQLLAE
jgi:PTS system galactitol-specific IIA component